MADVKPGSGNPRALPFTAAARRLLAGAQEEATDLRHEYVGTEHVLLALARDADAATLLARLGVDPAAVRATLLSAVRPGAAALPSGAERPYTSRTQRTFALAAGCARALGQAGVGVEHLLVGLAREGRGIGAQVLQHHGLTAERAAAATQGIGTAGDA